MTKDVISKIRDLVTKIFSTDACHGLDHILRVKELALELAKHVNEDVDIEVLEIAALLHDIGRIISEERHAEISAKLAKVILFNYGYPKQKIDRVIEAILAHSFSTRVRSQHIEAKILSDADKIDALGAIGIARVFAYSGRYGRSLEDSIKHFYEKILKLHSLMYTEYGRRIALNRHEFVVQFIAKLDRELKGSTNAEVKGGHRLR